MAESFLDLIRRLEADPTFGPAMRADQGLALASYHLLCQAQESPLPSKPRRLAPRILAAPSPLHRAA
jgi:hypothetical protein